METKLFYGILIATLMMLMLIVFIIVLMYKYTKDKKMWIQTHNDLIAENKKLSLIIWPPMEAKPIPIRAVYTHFGNVEVNGQIMDAYNDVNLKPDTLYIRYYGELVPRTVLLYESLVGAVLVDEESEDPKPKFYPYNEVFLAPPNKYMVEGHIEEDEHDYQFRIVRLIEEDPILETIDPVKDDGPEENPQAGYAAPN